MAHQTPIFRLGPTVTIACKSLKGRAITDDDAAPHRTNEALAFQDMERSCYTGAPDTEEHREEFVR